jgi:hypothetical protein
MLSRPGHLALVGDVHRPSAGDPAGRRPTPDRAIRNSFCHSNPPKLGKSASCGEVLPTPENLPHQNSRSRFAAGRLELDCQCNLQGPAFRSRSAACGNLPAPSASGDHHQALTPRSRRRAKARFTPGQQPAARRRRARRRNACRSHPWDLPRGSPGNSKSGRPCVAPRPEDS